MIGKTFAGFTILDHLSRGGMSDIFLATDAVGNRYTLRALLPELRQNSTRRRQFTWGCKVLADLNHPNVIHLYQNGETDGIVYAILEYVDGPNLKERILRTDPGLKENRRLVLLGMAGGLAHVHDRGYLHLDFKPENVLVSRAYETKLIDFDLAVPRPAKPRRSPSSGTIAYWAPEQIAREPVDERADIFAYGVTAYEMITGKKPVSGNTREEVLEKYAEFDQHLVPLRDRVPDLPKNLEHVILKCLEQQVARRYPSMSLVVRDLQS